VSHYSENPTFLGALVRDSETVFFSPPLSPAGLLGKVIPPDANRQFDLHEGLTLLVSRGEGFRCTTEPREVQEPERGALPIRLVRTQVQILGLPLSARRGA
jgi:hypothetical protein